VGLTFKGFALGNWERLWNRFRFLWISRSAVFLGLLWHLLPRCSCSCWLQNHRTWFHFRYLISSSQLS